MPLLDQYNKERGIITYQNSHPTDWTGKVGLIYASDYGYASTNSECRENLRAGVVYDKAKEQYDIEIIEKQNREKYNPKFLFNRKEVTKYKNIQNYEDNQLIHYKDSFFKKIFNKIMNYIKRE